ncbi:MULTISPECIES: glycosyltransferase family 2 protein [unclassified Acinetobacter]|uniref:glycosyltransferase family 2 protein n=1 Tax=unclassified Acinetobacter TaxID=196816 RepID=UPI001C236D5C|nr:MULTISPECIES: glycosyltransferase family 2 protein [unclassified Acinetobacter]
MFSVVIPLYNKAYGIERALKSIINQNGEFTYEVIIVNDGSTDGSEQIAENFLSDNIRIIHQANAGVSVARNIGITNSKYEVICFLDADDWWEADYFSTLYNLIVAYPHEKFFLMGFQKVSKLGRKVVSLSKNPKIFKKFGNSFLNTRGLVTPSIAVKKDVLYEAGLFPMGVSLSEDLMVWSKIISKYNVIYTPQVVSNIYYEEDNSRANRTLKVPYVLEYYAKPDNSAKNIKKFLMYIYVTKLYQSIRVKDFESWKRRWVIGFKIFPLVSYILFFSIIFFGIKNVFKYK